MKILTLLMLMCASAHASLSPQGIFSINALSGSVQTIVAGSAGTDFAVVSSGAAHTLNLPTASATKRGLLATADYIAFNAKQAAGSYLTALTGDVTASGPGSAAATIANFAVTNAKIANGTIDLAAKVTGQLPVVNQASQPHTQVIEVDMNRVDSYTADGSITRPYKTVKAAVDASTCNSAALCHFRMAPGAYVEDNALAFKEWMYIDGVQRDLVTIRHTDNSAIVVDFTANVSHRAGFSNLTFVNGLIVDRTGDTTGGASLDMMNVWVGGALSDVGVGSGRDYLNMKHCFIVGAAAISGVSAILNWSNFMSTLDLGTTGAAYADSYSYYALITMEGSYIASNLGVTADTAKPMGFQTFHTNGDGAWSIVGTAAIDYYTDASGPLAGNTFTKTNVTTYRYGHLENLTYEPAATNWAGSAPTNVHDALERMAAQVKALGLGAPIP